MINLQLMGGDRISLADAANMVGVVTVSSPVNAVSGQIALLINKPDGTSVYLSDRQGAMAGSAATSNSWVSLGGGQFFRTVYYAVEGMTGGSVRIQKSNDNGATWIDGAKVFESPSHTLYEYGGWYDAATDRGYVPCLTGLDGGKFSLVLYVYKDHMTALHGITMLHDASLSPWYRATEGRIIQLSSGTLVLPVYSSTDNFTAMDSPSGLFRCPAGSDPSTASNWTYIQGSGCGTARGMIECQAVEMPGGDVLIEANTRSGSLIKQVWTNDGQNPGPSTLTEFVSPRTKADIVRLSDGGYAKIWCSALPTGNYEGPRANAVLAFSDDLIAWHDFHVVATGSFIYELYLQEINGGLRIRYWDWPNTSDASSNVAFDKWLDLGGRSKTLMKRTVRAKSLTAEHSASVVAVLGAATADAPAGIKISGISSGCALRFLGGGESYSVSDEGAFILNIPGAGAVPFDFDASGGF